MNKDRQLMQQALDALEIAETDGNCYYEATELLRSRLAHCDRCGKKLGGEGDIHTCTPDPIGDAQDRLIAELAAQPKQEPAAWGVFDGPNLHDMFFAEEDAQDMARLKGVGSVVRPLTTPPAAPMTEFEEAVAAVDNTLHHAINHWQNRASEQALLLRECRAALDALIDKKPALAMLLCGSTTLGNLRASLHDYRVKEIFDANPPAQPAPVPLTDDARGLLVIEHLGPNALLHKPMSIYDAFHMGIDAAESAHHITEKGQP